LQRRNFIRLSGISIGSLLGPNFSKAEGKKFYAIKLPDSVSVQTNEGWQNLQSSGSSAWTHKDVMVELRPVNDIVSVHIQSPTLPLKTVKLSWKYPISKTSNLLGDHWERTYGDAQWKPVEATAKMPWYVIQHDGDSAHCFGVKTGCSSICYWEANKDYLSLSLDTKTGGDGVQLGSRVLHGADIITTKNKADENVFATVRRFCKMMCDNPRKVAQPVYGINDWYFAYGNNSAELILQHTSLLAPLVTSTTNRPFSVIDDGWYQGNTCVVPNKKFGDMLKLTGQIKKLGMRPGIWTRVLCAEENEKPNLLMPVIKGRDDAKHPFLDPTIDENLERIKNYLITYRHWGYEMVKHDYTTFDIFGRWGFQMIEDITGPNWHFNDNTKTNAEIILNLYRAIREAAGETYIIGCNTVSHLSAGLFELNRIGDDTSGQEWARTRKMGVNTLGFRMVQHKTFYEADGDCVGLTNKIPWEKNKQWMQLLAESSAPLFISAQPEAVGEEQKQFIKKSFAQAAKPQPVAEPLDWLTNLQPLIWKLDGKEVRFDWS
jgi:alpha-galactosidase